MHYERNVVDVPGDAPRSSSFVDARELNRRPVFQAVLKLASFERWSLR